MICRISAAFLFIHSHRIDHKIFAAYQCKTSYLFSSKIENEFFYFFFTKSFFSYWLYAISTDLHFSQLISKKSFFPVSKGKPFQWSFLAPVKQWSFLAQLKFKRVFVKLCSLERGLYLCFNSESDPAP